jgi:hypothetical protein
MGWSQVSKAVSHHELIDLGRQRPQWLPQQHTQHSAIGASGHA